MPAKTSYGTSSRVVSGAFILGAASLASRIVGLLRERVLTSTFGASDTFDAFIAAFRLPDLIFNLLVIGALSSAFIPIFTERLVKDNYNKKGAYDFALSVLNIILLLVTTLCVLYVIFAPFIMPLIAPGFHGAKLAETIMLSRIMALQPILLCVSFVFSGLLNSFKKFTAYALAPIFYNAGIIFGVVVLVPKLGAAGLGWGVVLGAALHMLVQLPSVIKIGFTWRPVMHWSTVELRKLTRMVVPRALGLALDQIDLFIVTIVGSTLAAGSITVFNLANNVQSLPVGIFGLAFAQAAFPTMSELVARRQYQEFLHTLTKVFRYILFLIIPTAVFFFLLRAQMIRVLFGAGKFDWNDTILTFETFGIMLVSLFAQATIPLLARGFYVRQDTKTPVYVAIVSIIVDVSLALLLAPKLGVVGLAIAYSASTISDLILLLGILHWQLKGFDDKAVLWSLARISLAAVLAGVVVQFLKYPVSWVVDMTRFWGVFLQLAISFGGGVAAYIMICMLFRCEELSVIKKYLPFKTKFITKFIPDAETSGFSGLLE